MSDFWARRKAAVEAEAERETRDRLEAEAAAQEVRAAVAIGDAAGDLPPLIYERVT